MDGYKLEEEKLEEYAKLSSAIRLEISQKVSALAEE
jgi:iron uptake system EfeUOB component EfeO/EfeM